MFDIHRVEIDWGGRPLKLETGQIARQADGAVFAQYGETSVLATVVAAKSVKPGMDFFPLTVNYQEKTYAAGRFPGGFFKREGRPTEKETLTSRLIDRPIRPLFRRRASRTKFRSSSDRSVLRQRERSRHRRHDRCLAALTLSGAALPRADRRSTRRHDRRRIRPQPAARRDGAD
jgi:hypothetical protein